ncbi:phospholipase D-like domain-containing protein [Hallella absiana]|uniref:phospholipase D-like domain-containing protein n=1 Tax=Hallella absiana TaxID=2925336 RepID=UPI0021C7ADDC|nr:phospholipase D-like domain-containing protein [Hallella absiana]
MELQYYLNTYTTEPLTDRIMTLIKGARTYIKTGNFFFREPSIKQELVNACRRGVIVFILSNLREDEDRLAAGNKFSKKEYDPHLPGLMDLVEEGAHVRCIEELHAKFLLTDGEHGMIMSSNYTTNSLHGNPECGIDLSEKNTKYLECVFDTIFTHADTRLVGRGSNQYTFKSYSNPVRPEVFDNSGNDIVMTLAARLDNNGMAEETNFANCNIHDIYHEIANIIEDAERFVCLASFSFRAVSKLPLIKNAIINAAGRGVRVYLIYNIETPGSVQEIESKFHSLANIYAKGIPKNHAKFLITDKDGFVFTANIDGEAGLLSGFEVGAYLTEHQYNQAKEGINILIEQQK